MDTPMYKSTDSIEQDVVLKFKDALKNFDLEANTYFILLFDSKDPDQMTTVAQGDIVKLSAALSMMLPKVETNAMKIIEQAAINQIEKEKLTQEPKKIH